jgi:phage recombination protein Bet
MTSEDQVSEMENQVVSIVRAEPVAPAIWTPDLVDLIKKTVCPAGIPDGEFRLFIEKCKVSGMNPLQNECFCVPRQVKIGPKDRPQWVTQYVFQPGEAGMEARADRFPDYRGIRAAAVYKKDAIEIDPEAGTVSHKFNPVGDRGELVGAWAIAYREGRKTPVEFTRLTEYRQQGAMWDGKVETMIVKCARAAALRRAYPNAFSGVYVREEMQEEVEVTPTLPATPAVSRTSEVAAKVLARLPPKASPPKAAPAPQPAPEKPAEVLTYEKPTPPTPAPSSAPLGEEFVQRGKHKGKLLAELEADELTESVAEHEAGLAKTTKPEARAQVEGMLGLLKAELKRRMDIIDGGAF